MNPALILIIFLILVALWFLLSFVYHPLGRFIYRIWKDADDAINKQDEEKESENER